MPYSPTVWVDDAPPPINAANLNKIEQGIADAVLKAGDTMTGGLAVPNLLMAPDTGTAKGRFGTLPGVEAWIGMFVNAQFVAGQGWLLDDPTKPGWFLKVDSRNSPVPMYAAYYIPTGGGYHTDEYPVFQIDGNGKATIRGAIDAASIGGSSGSDLNLNTHIAANGKTIWGVADPTNVDWVTNKRYVDEQRDTRVAKAGDTMTGNLTVASNLFTLDSPGTASAILDKGASTNYAQFEFRTAGMQDYAIGTNLSGQLRCYVTQADVDSFSISKTDGRMTVVADPIANLGVATKQYVDNKPSGVNRSISTISSDTSASGTAMTDYFYICTAALTLTLPTAVGNTNMYTIKRTGTGNVTIATTASQTLDGAATFVIDLQWTAISVISDGTNWVVI